MSTSKSQSRTGPPYPLVLFDFDGTLADTMPWLSLAIEEMADEFGFKRLSGAEMDRLRDKPPSSILSEFGIPIWKIPRIASALRRKMSGHLAEIRLFPGIDEFLNRAQSAGVHLGIVSSNSESNVRTVLGAANAAQFQHYECGVGLFGKSSRLRRAARAARRPSAQVLYVGDELRDLDAAAKAGMPFGAVTWGCCRAATFTPRQPAAIFETIPEMQRFLIG